jgi:hypothetical protein
VSAESFGVKMSSFRDLGKTAFGRLCVKKYFQMIYVESFSGKVVDVFSINIEVGKYPS